MEVFVRALRGPLSLVLAGILTLLCPLAPATSAGSRPLVLDVQADAPILKAGEKHTIVARVLVKPDKTARRKRVPLAVALVLDRSGSMRSDGKMDNAKRGAAEALRMLDERDVAAVVAYDDKASVVLPTRSVGSPAPFRKAIDALRPGGSTALHDGVQTGAKQLRSYVDEGFAPRVILLSDGLANVGPSTTEELAALGRTLAGQGITITTIGLGLDYNEDTMTALAAESGGNAYFARDAGMLPGIFARDMEDAVTLTAQRVRVVVECGESARPVRVIGREGSVRGRTVEVPIHNLYGAEKYALIEMEVPPQKEGEVPLKLAQIRLEYTDAATGKEAVDEAPLSVTFSRDGDAIAKARRGDIVAQTELARNAEAREEAVRLADAGRTQEAVKLLNERALFSKSFGAGAFSAMPQADRQRMESEARALDTLTLGLTSGMSSEVRKEALYGAYALKNQQTEVQPPLPVSPDVSSADAASADAK